MVETRKKATNTNAYRRVGTGKAADFADIRDTKPEEKEETKEAILFDNVEAYPKSDAIAEKEEVS